MCATVGGALSETIMMVSLACSCSGTKNVPRPDRTDVVLSRRSTRNGSGTISSVNEVRVKNITVTVSVCRLGLVLRLGSV